MFSSRVTFCRYEKSIEEGRWAHRAVYIYEVTNGNTIIVRQPHHITFRPDMADAEALAESFPMPDGSRKTCAEIMADCQI